MSTHFENKDLEYQRDKDADKATTGKTASAIQLAHPQPLPIPHFKSHVSHVSFTLNLM